MSESAVIYREGCSTPPQDTELVLDTTIPDASEIVVDQLRTASQLHKVLFDWEVGGRVALGLAESLFKETVQAEDLYYVENRGPLHRNHPFLPIAVSLATNHPVWRMHVRGGTSSDEFWFAMDLLAGYGSGHDAANYRSGIDEVISGPLRVLQWAVYTPDIALQLGDSFFTKPTETRRILIRYIAALAEGSNLTIVGSHRHLYKLQKQHQDTLPPVSEQDTARLGVRSRETEQRARRILRGYAEDSLAHQIIHHMSSERDGVVMYEDLYNRFEVSDSRIRQVVNELDDGGALHRIPIGREVKVELLPVGEAVGERIAERSSQQQTFDVFEDE